MAEKGRKLVGSSLIEVLISLAILGILFAMGTNLILGLTNIGSPPEQFGTEVLIRNFLEEPIGAYFQMQEERELGGRKLIRKIRWEDEKQALAEIEVVAFYLDKEVGRRKILKYLKTE
ncbi:MAG: prepilin-type N-terminal cleavage/methylation domain-containing protein [Bacteroidia bacterium]|nr:prepilin-type N-terminal cleavage/methylation domain-containing protein [Bacteroidia bacterium]